MADASPNNAVSRLRRVVRGCRVSALFLLFLAVTPLIFLNIVGLPDFVKTSVVESLRQQGLELEFDSMRLLPVGVVVEKVSVAASRTPGSPKLGFDEILLGLDFTKLLARRVEVTGLHLRKGKFAWPVQSPGQPPRSIAVDKIGVDVRFQSGGLWVLEELDARWPGGRLRASGALTNASKLGELSRKPSTGSARTNTLERTVYRVAEILEQVRFRDSADLRLEVFADAADWGVARGRLQLNFGGGRTPWVSIDTAQLSVELSPDSSAATFSKAALHVKAAGGKTSGLSLPTASLDADLRLCWTNWSSFGGDWTLKLDGANDRSWSVQSLQISGKHQPVAALGPSAALASEMTARAARLKFESNTLARMEVSIHASHDDTFAVKEARVEIKASELATPNASAGEVLLRTTARAAEFIALQNPSWQLLRDRFQAETELEAARLTVMLKKGAPIPLDGVTAKARWHSPKLDVDSLEVRGFNGAARFSGGARLPEGDAQLELVSSVDPLAVWKSLDPVATRWMERIQLTRPPGLRAQVRLPALDRTSDSQRLSVTSLLGRLEASAVLDLGPGSAYGVSFQSIESSAAWKSGAWTVPQLRLSHEKGWVELGLAPGTVPTDFHLVLTSQLDPRVLKPLFNERTGRTLDAFEFESPPKLSAVARGSWTNLAAAVVSGSLEATNISYQSNLFHHLKTGVAYQAPMLRFSNVHLRHGSETLDAGGIDYDLKAQWLYFTNGVAAMEVKRVTQVIGPKTTAAVAPYRFETPPKVRVWGSLPIKNDDFTDMHFEIEGGAFSYWRFRVPQIAARVDWVTNTLSVSNVTASFYQGRMKGDFFFDFEKVPTGELRFDANFEKSDLRTLLSDLTSPTNRADGVLDGRFSIRSGLSSDMRSWQGDGEMKLEQGYLWNVPLFSILSPVLNAVSSGLGNSRGGKATMTFQVRDGQAHTEDLLMHEPTMRLHYRGLVDLDGALNARVEAELLRSGWFPGRALSFALSPLSKLFEYKVSGTLGQPKLEPLYFIPKVLLFPFNPYKGIKELFQDDPKAAPKPPKE